MNAIKINTEELNNQMNTLNALNNNDKMEYIIALVDNELCIGYVAKNGCCANYYPYNEKNINIEFSKMLNKSNKVRA